MTFQLVSGDCLDALSEMEEASVDAVVTDPPYGISFMGKEWDGPSGMLGQMATGKEQRGALAYGGTHSRGYADNDNRAFQVWVEAWATELLRVLKPGGHLVAFGGTRTYHRLASGIEDAGFEIRDCLAWMYGSGFPKSLDVSKAIDKAAGAEREDVLEDKPRVMDNEVYGKGLGVGVIKRRPATEAARQWQGWGTALKPAYEPIILARKPLTGTVAANVQEFGTGALNVDGCRVGTEGGTTKGNPPKHKSNGVYGDGINGACDIVLLNEGRWPANVILDGEAGAMLDEQTGDLPGGNYPAQRGEGVATGFGAGRPTEGGARSMGDTGGASRFFYTAKASRAERNAGLDGFEKRETRGNYGDGIQDARPHTREDYEYRAKTRNVHPTVKPIDLMRYLVRLVTPPGGTVLDPFTGSGTTGIAAGLEGFNFVGIEREAEYREIAEARLKWWADQEGETVDILRRAGLAEKEREQHEQAGQTSLFEAEAA